MFSRLLYTLGIIAHTQEYVDPLNPIFLWILWSNSWALSIFYHCIQEMNFLWKIIKFRKTKTPQLSQVIWSPWKFLIFPINVSLMNKYYFLCEKLCYNLYSINLNERCPRLNQLYKVISISVTQYTYALWRSAKIKLINPEGKPNLIIFPYLADSS